MGKSEIAYLLAKQFGAEILSVDAFQFYRGLPIGTNQPDSAWMKEVPHHLVACRDPKEFWSAPQYAAEALRVLKEKQSHCIPMIAVGGSGFYLRALLEGAPEGSASDPTTREGIFKVSSELGPEATHRWLQKHDPAAAARLNPNDSMRVRRALEKSLAPPVAPIASTECWGEKNAVVFGLECSRDRLDENLRRRTELIWKNGLLVETQKLIDANISPDAPVWGAIGYREGLRFIQGSLTKEEALERIFRRTRQYAKRQWTWFRHHHNTQWVNLDSFPDVPSVVLYLSEQIKPLWNV